ncbi:MAG TPA: Nramp family divalent metal transporter [Patescibacteria group bacterium]|nr:Nramp family divalent metal transporter [Patescibacteria group bacterium]
MLKREYRVLPEAPGLRKLIGPSFILLGLGLGSGEIILWPYLASNWGLGIVWGAFLGLFFQFFINMEIERYSLVRGESVFVGLARRWRWVPLWLIFSTLVGFGWPGIIASSAFLFSKVFGGNSTIVAIIFLILIGGILSFGKYIYSTVEHFSKYIILIGVPFIIILAIWLADGSDWTALAQGVIGKGNNFWFLPAGIPIASFLAAFAFSGAGGNLNLAQSVYIREKGYAMGYFMEKTKSLFAGSKQQIDLNGFEFQPTAENMNRFAVWWKNVNREHAIVFWFTGLITIFLLLLLAFTTTFGLPDNASGIQFVINEARVIGEQTIPFIGTLFILVTGLMLFSTQFSIMDSTSRIMSENYAAFKARKNKGANLSKLYYFFLWAQILFSIVVFAFGFNQPFTLLTISAVINAVCMFVHIGLVNVLNYKELPKEIQPLLWRRVIILISFLFFGFFSAMTFWDQFLK